MFIRFAPEDLQLFRAASHDANPLHLSSEYARRTPYGEPVVFGILGAIAAAGNLQDRPERVLRRAEIEFSNPLYIGVDYRVEVRQDDEHEALILVSDASRLMAKYKYAFQPHDAGSARPTAATGAVRSEPAVWRKTELRCGIEVTGKYAAEFGGLQRLVERWSVHSKGFGWRQLAALLWSSYFVGMELPGREATFWKARIEFNPAVDGSGEIEYDAHLQRLDERFDMLEMNAQLAMSGRALAAAQLWAFLRPESPQCSLAALKALLPGNQSLRDKVAVVAGGSRGLGSATALALALSGCTVYLVYHRCREQAERLRKLVTPEEIVPVQCDATDPKGCRDLLDQINERHNGLDILVCNASPPIQPLSFASETIDRFHRFLNESLSLVTVPMSVFLPSLEKKSGWNVVISSEAVRTNPAHWPHYVTAKCAIEGLTHWAAAQFKRTRFLVVRPPKLLTDQMNTPSGRHGATPVEPIAAAVATRLGEPASGSTVEIMETFAGRLDSPSAVQR
jgi:NAD(P)-dependent dehydrogenase (short-subunit alcohol dehydrogenase family)/acyl dehydratase